MDTQLLPIPWAYVQFRADGSLAPREARSIGKEMILRKSAIVVQWVHSIDSARPLSAYDAVNPTYSKPSQQSSSEPHVQTWQREYGAGGIKNVGRAIEPRNFVHCGSMG